MSKPFLKNIIVAVNGTQSSVQAAMYSIILAKQYNLSVKAVFVVDTATIKFLTNSRFLVSDEKNSFEEDLKRDGKNALDYVSSLAKSKGVKLETELRSGSVWAEIINAADEYEADMIIMGGHESKSKMVQSLDASPHRSVAATARSEIVKYAHCPVLVVHKPEMEALFKVS